MTRPAVDRFWEKVSSGDLDECWEWRGTRSHGYGQFRVRVGVLAMAHRFAYESLRAEIPTGLQLDHLCRNHACVNPWHLEPVTNRENVRRGLSCRATDEVCAHGHPWTEHSMFMSPNGKRRCRTCNAARMREQYRAIARKRARLAVAA